MKRINASGSIFYAWSDEPWFLDGAAVRISIVGFDGGEERCRILNGISVDRINADLSSIVDVTTAQRLPENSGIAFMGDTKGGPFDVTEAVARNWLDLPINPNGRPNSDVVRPWVNGLDIVRRPRNMWIIDFGTEMNQQAASFYEAPFGYVVANVKPIRIQNRRESYARFWWRHVEPRPAMWRALDGLNRFIVTPAVARHRLFSWLNSEVVPDHRLFVFARQDDYFFGVLHSRAHEIWSLARGSWQGAGNDPVYTPTTCFETFPLPWTPGQEPWRDERLHAIANAARELDETRNRWLNPPDADEATLKKRTLTNLYNERPTWLAHLHAALDRAVWSAYGWDDDPAQTTDEAILERLLALNQQRAKG